MSRLERSRRAFLKTVGAGAATLPFFKLLERSAVEAQTVPLRFIGIYAPHGVAKELWRPRDGFNITYDNCSLAPFDDPATYGKSFKDKLLVIEGIDLAAGIRGGAAGHDAPRCILTGSGSSGANPSIDQYLALDKQLGAQTRVASIVLGVGNNLTDNQSNISYAKGGAPLPKIIDPMQTFNLLFSNFVPSGDAVAQAAADAKRKRGQSVIDFVRGDLQRLDLRLAGPERIKLDQHLSSIRELEKRLAGQPVQSCGPVVRPDGSLFPSVQTYNGGEPYFDAITNLQIDLLAQAMACDLTRFASLFLSDLSRTKLDPTLPDDVHAGVAHAYNGSETTGYTDPGNPSTWLPLAKQNRYCYGKAARLLQKLDQFGVLDSAIVYMTSDMGNPGAHRSTDVPTIIAGGTNGAFNMGRSVVLPKTCPPDKFYCDDQPGQNLISNNKILVSILQAFGVNENSFGSATDPAITTGPLAELKE
jgi:Protein of unknown function (DUF1552)